MPGLSSFSGVLIAGARTRQEDRASCAVCYLGSVPSILGPQRLREVPGRPTGLPGSGPGRGWRPGWGALPLLLRGVLLCCLTSFALVSWCSLLVCYLVLTRQPLSSLFGCPPFHPGALLTFIPRPSACLYHASGTILLHSVLDLLAPRVQSTTTPKQHREVQG